MNFLAHALLSGSNRGILVGNFMGDFVKGKQYAGYPKEISRGILLHRQIDTFTDQHVCVKNTKTKLRPLYGHFSSVIVDIFYDHLLAVNWHVFADEDLEPFTAKVYSIIDDHFHLLPSQLQYIFPKIRQNNWLLNYGHIEGVKRALAGMSRRSKFKPELQNATDLLVGDFEDYNQEFMIFFPDVVDFAAEWLEKNGG